jgi:ABC transport system ATP-binding/permease protein
MWVLQTTETSETPATFRMPAGSVKTIGRSTGAEFILDAPLVSRLHCQLTAHDAGLEVKDLDSTNGTFVNGTRVTSARLQTGDRLRVGRTELTISKTD